MSGRLRGLVMLALVATIAGCLRFGYAEREQSRDSGSDSGASGAREPSDAGEGGRRAGAGAGAGGEGGGGGGASGEPAADGGGPSGDAETSDAGVTDAGVSDSGVTDAEQPDDDAGTGGSDAGTSPFCPERSDALFCDDFEATNFDRWAYPIVTNGTLARSTLQRRSGEASLRATTGAASDGNEARYATNSLGGLTSGDLWMRYYYFLPGSVTVNTHFSAGVMSEIQQPYAGFSLIVRSARVDLSTMAGPVQGSMTFPRDRWVCVELHVTIHPSAGVFEAYLDGALAVRSGLVDSVPSGGFKNAEVGIHYAEAEQGPVEAYVDDVVVGLARIPCD